MFGLKQDLIVKIPRYKAAVETGREEDSVSEGNPDRSTIRVVVFYLVLQHVQ